MEKSGKTNEELLNELKKLRQRVRELERLRSAHVPQRDVIDLSRRSQCALLDSFPDPSVIYDVDGKVQYINPSFEEKFGWALEDVVGRRMPFVPKSKENETAGLVADLLKTGKACDSFETQRLTKNGELIDVSLSASRCELSAGGEIGILAIHRDIRAWKKIQADLGAELDNFQELHALAVGMSANFSLEENLHLVVESSRSVLNTDAAYIALGDSKLPYVFLKKFTGINTESFQTARISLRTGIAGQVVKSSSSVVIEDCHSTKGGSSWDRKKYQLEGLISVVAAPVRIGGVVTGVLYAANRSKTKFTERDVQTLELFANLAAIEVARKRDQRKLENELERFKQLYDVAKEMRAERKLNHKLQLILRKCKSLFNVDVASLSLRRGALRIGAVRESAGAVTDEFKDLVTSDDVGTPEILLRTGKGFKTQDYYNDGKIKQDPVVTRILKGEKIVSCMVVPVMTGATHLGRLGLYRKEKALFTSEEMKTLQLFANLAALEVTRAEAIEKLEALHEVALDMTADRPLPEKLEIVAKKAKELMHTDLSYVSIIDHDAGTVEACAAAGVRTEGFRQLKMDLGGGMGGKAERMGEVLLCEDYFAEYRPEDEVAKLCKEEGVQSAIVAPVIMQGEPVGRLWVINRKKTRFDPSRLDPMLHLSNLAAIEVAYHRALQRLSRSRDEAESLVEKRTLELQNEVKRFQALYDLAISMTGRLSLEAKLTKVVEKTQEFLKTHTSYIALRDDLDPETFYLHSSAGIHTERFRQCRLRIGEGIAGVVARTGEGVIVRDYLRSDMNIPPSSFQEAREEGLRSVLAAPVMMGGEVLGVLYASNREITEFSGWQLQTLEFFGKIAAVEIDSRNQEMKRLAEEKERRKTEEKLRLIADHLPVLIAYVNSDQRYEFVNRMFGILYGRDIDSIIGMRVEELVGVEVYNSQLRKDIEHALSGNQTGHPYMVPGRNGNEKHWKSIFVPHRKRDKTIGFVALVEEITKEKIYERKLEKAKERCEEEVRERTKDLHGAQARLKALLPELVHDVSGPLRHAQPKLEEIRSGLESSSYDEAVLVQEAAKELPVVRRFLDQIVNHMSNLRSITEELTPLYQVLDKYIKALYAHDLGPLKAVLNMQELVREEIESLGLQDEVTITKTLPSIRADESYIRVIIRHLFNNSSKYRHPDRKLLIRISTAGGAGGGNSPDETTFCYSDNGLGMSEDDREHAFDRGWTKQRVGAGGGFGLYLCRCMVRQHGGELWCDSKLGEGTTFWFTIPQD